MDNKPPPRAWQWSTLSHSVCFLDLTPPSDLFQTPLAISVSIWSNHGPGYSSTIIFHGLIPCSWLLPPRGKHHFLCSPINVKGVTSLGRHTRPACHQALFEIVIKKVDFDLHIVYFSWTFGDARGLGLLFMVCASAVGLRGNVLIGMRGTWGVVWRSAHVPTIPFTWLRRAKALGPTVHASYQHATIGVFLWMPMFFTPCSLSARWLVERGHVNFLMTFSC